MSITTCAVVARIWDSVKGVPVPNATVTATLNAYDTYEGFVAPHRVSVVTNALGEATLNLFPNVLGTQGTFYDISIQSGLKGSLKAMAVVPDQPTVMLEDITTLDPYPGQGPGGNGTPNAVSYAVVQNLTDAQKARARANIGVDEGGGPDFEAALEEMQNIKAACVADNLSAVAQVQAIAIELRQQQ